ncbi:MAG: 3-deoxy-D-manno-octulosonic acid kinase [Gammaproteobacteria bacterium]
MAESSTGESLISIGKQHILYDASLVEHPEAALFDIDGAQQNTEVSSLAEGRGQAVFFKCHEHDVVLKHYQRGGKMAALLGDRYIGTDCNKSRSFREWRLLEHMRSIDLPVPSPVAARCCKSGLFYRADLITMRIKNVVTLADYLLAQECNESLWHAVGLCLRRFHDESVYHADLNARNILLNTVNEKVYLVDFDKGGIRYLGESWKAANLARLQRSLLKFKSLNDVFYYDHGNWRALLDGYNKGQQ